MFFNELCVRRGNTHHFINSSRQSVDVLSAGSCEMGLSAATAADELLCLTHHLTGIQLLLADHIVAKHHR